jgi:hypothetical protein
MKQNVGLEGFFEKGGREGEVNRSDRWVETAMRQLKCVSLRFCCMT